MKIQKALALAALSGSALHAGPKLSWDDGLRSLEIAQTAQIWGVGTYDPKSADNGTPVDPRADVYLRRYQLTFKGNAYTNLSYQFSLAMDNVGKDSLTGTVGGPQNSNPTTIQVQDAYVGWKAYGNLANVTFGLLKPVLSRGLISSFTSTTSLDNPLTYTYERDHLLTASTARASGIGLGGQWGNDTAAFLTIGYDAGVFDVFQDKSSASATPASSSKWAPLLTGRLSVTIGDPESKAYGISRSDNSLGARNGITFGLFGSYQGATGLKIDSSVSTSTVKKVSKTVSSTPAATTVDADSVVLKTSRKYVGGFDLNSVTGADVFVEFHGFTLNGEVAWLYREFSDADAAKWKGVLPANNYTDFTWHVRAAYAIPVKKTFVEPSAMFTRFEGDANSAANPSGEDQQLDLGVNWYLQKNNVKLGLHWILQDGTYKSGYQGAATTATGTRRVRDDVAVASVQLMF